MKKFIASSFLFVLPAVTLAQGEGDIAIEDQNLSGIVTFIQSVLNVAVQLLIAAAVVYFLFGVFEFVRSGGDEEARKKGREKIIAGIIGIAVMVSVWGLVAWITNTAGTEGATVGKVPSLPSLTGTATSTR